MIPYAKDRFSKENERKFALTVSNYQNNWEYYYIQYSKVLDFLLGIANEEAIAPRNTHNLKELANEIDADFSTLISTLPNLFAEDDGAIFRYDTSKDGNPYFGKYHILHAYSDCQVFIQFTRSNKDRFSLYPISQGIDLKDKIMKHELSFYTNECRDLGVIRVC